MSHFSQSPPHIMIHMDIDVRPPRSPSSSLRTFLQGSMSSAKRARSPDSTSHLDRPAKRLFIANHAAAMDSADFSDSSFGETQPAASSRFPYEDWVRQAKGLSIDNTTPYESRSTNSSYEHLGGQSDDVDMMDSLEDSPEPSSQTPHLPSGSNVCLGETRYHSGIPHRLLPHLHYKVTHPEINVTPATPISAAPSVSSSIQDLTEPRHSSLPLDGSSMSMALTPPSPALALRRPKFSMGPRADCEKCRLGVKGHWAHFD